MPLNREMSAGEICHAAQDAGGAVVSEWDISIRRALQMDGRVYFEQPDGDRRRRVRDCKPINFTGVRRSSGAMRTGDGPI